MNAYLPRARVQRQEIVIGPKDAPHLVEGVRVGPLIACKTSIGYQISHEPSGRLVGMAVATLPLATQWLNEFHTAGIDWDAWADGRLEEVSKARLRDLTAKMAYGHAPDAAAGSGTKRRKR